MRAMLAVVLLLGVLSLAGPWATAGDFAIRPQLQLGMGQEEHDHPADADGSYSWSTTDRFYDLGVIVEGAMAIEIARGLDGELGGLFGINFDVVKSTSYGAEGDESSSNSTALRLTLGIAPQLAAQFKMGEHGYMRPFVSLGPMVCGQLELGDSGGMPSDGFVGAGTTFRVGLEGGADGLPLCVALGYQSYQGGFNRHWQDAGVVFLALGRPSLRQRKGSSGEGVR
jgi:hypothetical protein